MPEKFTFASFTFLHKKLSLHKPLSLRRVYIFLLIHQEFFYTYQETRKLLSTSKFYQSFLSVLSNVYLADDFLTKSSSPFHLLTYYSPVLLGYTP